MTLKPLPLYALFSPLKYIVSAFLLLTIIALLKSYIPQNITLYLTLGILVVLLTAYVLEYLFIKSISYTFTEEQLIYTRGIFTITTDYIELYRVVDSKLIYPFLMRFIGGMCYHLDTLDKSHPVFLIKGIPKSTVDRQVRDLVEKARIKKRVFITE